VSVVLNTYNRSALLARAIRSVLAQSFADFELVVVDDDSVDSTADVVASFADPRITFARQDHAGLSASRNRGAALASGEWIVFLDDDDEVEQGWLAAFEPALADDVGIVFAGHLKVSTVDGSTRAFPPEPMGELFGGVTGGWLAGSWIIRRSLFEATGGFATDLPTLVQSEFLIRAIPACRAAGLRTSVVDDMLLRYSEAPWYERPTLTADLTIRAATTIMERHAGAFEADRSSRSEWHGVIGVAAARSRRWSLARRHFVRAVRDQPRDPRKWARVALSCLPGRGRVWTQAPPRHAEGVLRHVAGRSQPRPRRGRWRGIAAWRPPDLSSAGRRARRTRPSALRPTTRRGRRAPGPGAPG
jgi:hypothetical protein